jgi:chromosome segregation protein
VGELLSGGILEYVTTLEERDRELAAALRLLDEAGEETAAIRSRAGEIRALLAGAPHERARLSAELASARSRLAAEQTRLREARAALERAEERGSDGEAESRRIALLDANAAVRTAEDHLRRLRRDSEQLEEEVETAKREVPALEARARAAASQLASVPSLAPRGTAHPEAGLEGVSDWAARARAAVFVARGSLARERDVVIREANELAASVLGDAALASSVTLVRARLEREPR